MKCVKILCDWEFKAHGLLTTLIDIWGKYIMTGKMGTVSKIEMSGNRAESISSGHEKRDLFC